MKNFAVLLSVFSVFAAFGAAQYEFDPGRPGYRNGSLNILEDISSLTLYSDFGSVGNSGAVGYYVYTDDPGDAVSGATTFRKHDGKITLPELRAGEKVGFFLVRNNGTVVSDFNFVQSGDRYFLAFRKNGGGRDEWMLFNSIHAESAPAATGQPLPGVVLSLAAGALVLILLRRHVPVRKAAR